MAPTQQEPTALELRACPFCGSRNITTDQLGNEARPFFVMTCGNCQADGPVEVTEAQAAEAWNTRVESKGDGDGQS